MQKENSATGTLSKTAEARGAAETSGAVKREVTMSRVMFYSHLWFGVLFTVALLVIGITGILLNHKREIGIMPDVPHEPTGAFSDAVPLAALAHAAFDTTGIPNDVKSIDRMDVRPRNGFVKVRFRDKANTEVTVDINSGKVLHVGPRGDVFMEKLHSGEIFGENGILLSDFAAGGLVLLLISGYWLWLKPRVRR